MVQKLKKKKNTEGDREGKKKKTRKRKIQKKKDIKVCYQISKPEQTRHRHLEKRRGDTEARNAAAKVKNDIYSFNKYLMSTYYLPGTVTS